MGARQRSVRSPADADERFASLEKIGDQPKLPAWSERFSDVRSVSLLLAPRKGRCGDYAAAASALNHARAEIAPPLAAATYTSLSAGRGSTGWEEPLPGCFASAAVGSGANAEGQVRDQQRRRYRDQKARLDWDNDCTQARRERFSAKSVERAALLSPDNGRRTETKA